MSFRWKVFGWMGTVLFLASYGLMVLGRLGSSGVPFLSCNVLASFLVGAYSFDRKDWPNVTVYTFWGLLSVVALLGVTL